MTLGDRGLDAVRTEPSTHPPAVASAARPRRIAELPPSTVLFLEQHGLPVVADPRGKPCGGQLQEREQAVDLGLVGDQPRQHPGLTDRLVGEVLPDPVAARRRRRALREHQVEDVQHRRQPFTALVGRRHLERDLRRAERLLRAGDPGLDRGGRHEERPGDLVAGQTAYHAALKGHSNETIEPYRGL